MASKNTTVQLVFPNQLFEQHFEAGITTKFILVEEDLFYRQFPFHKQKLILHRAGMRYFQDELKTRGFEVEILETSSMPSLDGLREILKRISPTHVAYFDLTDDWLQRGIDRVTSGLYIKTSRLVSPGFLTSPGQIDEYFENNPNRMQHFYTWQRRRLNILMDGSKPVGGKWSFDEANRKKLPKGLDLPKPYPKFESTHVTDAITWVDGAFSDNPGNAATFDYPVTHADAAKRLEHFIEERLSTFGPYEDAISTTQSELFHSVLSPMINVGLLTPQQVVGAVLTYADKHEVDIASLEGFIRQVIGWREYMRATYVKYGRRMRSGNFLEFKQPLKAGWWDGSVGLDPIDTVIGRVLETGYAHHIERLMILGNAMVLLRIDPDQVYEWFMAMFIDAYDWVMVPNVYAMSQFSAGELITTKPYISGSNYIMKMSDYKKGEWNEIWDSLYWRFIDDYRQVVERNFRTRMVINLYERFNDEKKDRMKLVARDWLA